MKDDSGSPVPRVLLLNYGDPSSSGVGELFINAMMDGYPRSKLVRFSTFIGADPLRAVDWDGASAQVASIRWSAIPGYSSLLDWHYRFAKLSRHVEQVLALVAEHDVKVVWIILNDPRTIHIAHALISRLTIPYVAMVWDSPEYLLARIRLDLFSSRRILVEFGEVIRNAFAVVTVSPGMADIYRARFQTESSQMLYCPPAEMWRPAGRCTDACSDDVEIVFAGSLYAWREWGSLLDAVEYHNRKQASPHIRVTCLGKQSHWARKRKWVKYIDYQPQSRAHEIVQAADVAYLPYWMDAKHAYSARTAFPSKLPSYLAAGVPIFYHGPRDSTPAAFLERYPVGVCCHSYRRVDILAALHACVRDQEFLGQYSETRQRAFDEVFNPALMAEQFRSIVGISSGVNRDNHA